MCRYISHELNENTATNTYSHFFLIQLQTAFQKISFPAQPSHSASHFLFFKKSRGKLDFMGYDILKCTGLFWALLSDIKTCPHLLHTTAIEAFWNFPIISSFSYLFVRLFYVWLLFIYIIFRCFLVFFRLLYVFRAILIFLTRDSYFCGYTHYYRSVTKFLSSLDVDKQNSYFSELIILSTCLIILILYSPLFLVLWRTHSSQQPPFV